MNQRISLVIPTFNRAEYLRRTLANVAQVCRDHVDEVELLVIDNNCTDDTARVVAEAAADYPFSLRRIVERNQGLCHGRNRGIREARFEHLGFLDDDIAIHRDWIAGYFAAIASHDADCVVGPVFPWFEQDVPEYLSQRVLASISSPYSDKGRDTKVLPCSIAHEIPGCNFGVRKAVAEEVGGFDPALDRIGNNLGAGGDFDFGVRLVAAKKRVVYSPQCAIDHIIVPEKLTKPYLRRRWLGMGATQRKTQMSRGNKPDSRLRGTVQVARLGAKTGWLMLKRDYPQAFERELETWQALGQYGFVSRGV